MLFDAQIHIWCSDRPSLPWSPEYRRANRDRPTHLQHAGQTNTAAMALEEMAEVGVDGAILTSLGIYGLNCDLEIAAVRDHPTRFRFVGTVDPAADDVAARLSALRDAGMIGVRIPEMRTAERAASGAFDRVLAACDDLALAVMLPAVNDALPAIARRYARAFFWLNHLGTGLAPPIVGFRPDDPFAEAYAIVALAEAGNVGLKLTGTPALSREEYPFRDIWQPVVRLIGAYGPDRVAWGSDYTRTAGLYSYRDGTRYLREIPALTDDDRALLYGEALAARIGWRPGGPAS